jgi:lauroyl/myristoyl acyltransferase
MARIALPFIRMTQAYQEQHRGNVDGAYEIALHFILNTLTKNEIEFDPVITVHGYEELLSALAHDKGVLAISPHTVLSLLMPRFFRDAGHDPVVIGADPQMRVSGTTVTAETVQPSPTFLVVTRSRLRAGRLVCAMPDRGEHSKRRTIEFVTANGRIILATALMEVAARCEAKVIFFETHIEDGGVVANLIAPPLPSACSADAITEAFIEFIQAHINARLAYLH